MSTCLPRPAMHVKSSARVLTCRNIKELANACYRASTKNLGAYAWKWYQGDGKVESTGTMPFTGMLVWEGSLGQIHVVQVVGTFCGCGDDTSAVIRLECICCTFCMRVVLGRTW
jgi:hypothetical protein